MKGQGGCLFRMSTSVFIDLDSQKALPCQRSCISGMRQQILRSKLKQQNKRRLESKSEYLYYLKGWEVPNLSCPHFLSTPS